MHGHVSQPPCIPESMPYQVKVGPSMTLLAQQSLHQWIPAANTTRDSKLTMYTWEWQTQPERANAPYTYRDIHLTRLESKEKKEKRNTIKTTIKESKDHDGHFPIRIDCHTWSWHSNLCPEWPKFVWLIMFFLIGCNTNLLHNQRGPFHIWNMVS